MAIVEEEPSQAYRAEAVAEVGPGADTTTHDAGMGNEKQGNEARTSPSGSFDVGAEPQKELEVGPPARSKGKIALIMGALCVRLQIPI